jgi:Xaa-Pro aminopeptidase
VDEVLAMSSYQDRARKRGVAGPNQLHALVELLRERAIRDIDVPRTFPIEAADFLRERDYKVSWHQGAYFPQREHKTREEIDEIRKVQRHTEAAMDAAVHAIRDADVAGGVLHKDGVPLTSECVKSCIARALMDKGCTGRHTIVACGDQACDPHDQGSGPLPAGVPIVIDIFSRSNTSGYYADITRTVVKDSAPKVLTDIYDTVLDGQLLALDRIRAGVDGLDIHTEILQLFESRGYKSGEQDGRMQGFFHGTGHGVGLEIHEPPRISKASCELAPGHVVTVEPGLYYVGKGAVRIEDLVVVTQSGCENLTDYPKMLVV